ncbi:MAG TPA: monofunctional biosynthetic peptidoglycan transglycosylase [Candidatus Limnocylindria bacterium]|nr:monofunctional biosynthetic peptidoglycan transglycosylase [Candidatus Limnocylindria bacterium]
MPRARWILAVLALALAGYWVWSVVVQTSLIPIDRLARTAPSETRLMQERKSEAARKGKRHRADQRWVGYSQISPLLRRAVLIAEDDAFFAHGGLDWNEMRASAQRNLERRRIVRGGSTITQQLAKNLYLGGGRTVSRKLKEMVLASRLERALDKRRIFELYLNLIEWGDGIYGVEAASRRHFGVSAANLDSRQAVLLAAVIINPRRYSPLHPPARIERRARTIASRMRKRGLLSKAQYAQAIGRPLPSSGALDWLFGPLAPAKDTAASLPEPERADTLDAGEPEPTPDSANAP